MGTFIAYLISLLVVASILALLWVALKLKASSQRIMRSIDPINQKVKGLKLEVSALQHSRLDRQRRLETRNKPVSE
jgi:uncharacterized protein YoxC